MKKSKLRRLRTKIISAILCGMLLASAAPNFVYADDSNVGVDEIVLTLLASMNMGIADSATLGAIHNALNFPAASATVSQIQNGLNAVASQIDLNGIFATTVSQAEELLSTVADGWTTLTGVAATAAAASGADNLAATIATWRATSILAPAIGGLMTEVRNVAAMGARLSLGLLSNNIDMVIGNLLIQGTSQNGIWLNIGFKYGYQYLLGSNGWYCRATNNDESIILYEYENGTSRHYYIVNNSDETIEFYQLRPNGSVSGNYPDVRPHTIWDMGIYGAENNPFGGIEIPSGKTVNDFLIPNKGYDSLVPASPDYVTGDGNAKVTIGSNGPEISGLYPTYDPTINIIQVIPWDKFQDMADEAQNNNGNNIDNDELIRNLIRIYLGPLINDEGIPVQPQITPKPIYTPIPTVSPYPTIAPEQNDENLKGQVSGLENIFPFCIPWDLAKMFGALESTRRAPHIHWDATFGSWGKLGEVDIDMSQWDSVAAACRQFVFILFCVGLAMVTKDIIWG